MFFMARRVWEPAQYTDLFRRRESGQGRQNGVRIQRVFTQYQSLQFHHGYTRVVTLPPVIATVDIDDDDVCTSSNKAKQSFKQKLARMAALAAVNPNFRHSGTDFADAAYDGRNETRQAIPVTQSDSNHYRAQRHAG